MLCMGAAAHLMGACAADQDSSDPVAELAFDVLPASPGALLPAREDRWTYIEFPGARCRDGSAAGLYTIRGAAKKLAIILEGGGMCESDQSCLVNADNMQHPLVALGDLMLLTGTGLFNRQRSDNPIHDWSVVYVPYCTGDQMIGANPHGFVPNVGPQMFVGYTNLQQFMAHVAPTFADVTDVLVTGSSAGGFAGLYNAPQIQRAFPALRVKVLDDSGPLLSQNAVAPCYQDRQRELWNLDETVLAECGADCPDPSDFALDYAMFVVRSFGDRPSGLLSWTRDQVISGYLGAGRDECTYGIDFLNPGVSTVTFSAELTRFRERVRAFPEFSTFYADGVNHTLLVSDDLYSLRAGDVSLAEWLATLVRGESPGHAGP